MANIVVSKEGDTEVRTVFLNEGYVINKPKTSGQLFIKCENCNILIDRPEVNGPVDIFAGIKDLDFRWFCGELTGKSMVNAGIRYIRPEIPEKHISILEKVTDLPANGNASEFLVQLAKVNIDEKDLSLAVSSLVKCAEKQTNTLRCKKGTNCVSNAR